MSTSFQWHRVNDFPALSEASANLPVLYKELTAAISGPSLVQFKSEDNVIDVEWSTALTGAEQTTQQSVVDAHTGVLEAEQTLDAPDSPVTEWFVAELNSDDDVHTSTSDQDVIVLSATVSGGKYKLRADYTWAVDSTSKDFFACIVQDATELNSHRQEAKESGGSDGGTGSGTDQRHTSSLSRVLTLAAGSYTFKLQTRSQESGVEVTVYRYSTLELVRIGD